MRGRLRGRSNWRLYETDIWELKSNVWLPRAELTEIVDLTTYRTTITQRSTETKFTLKCSQAMMKGRAGSRVYRNERCINANPFFPPGSPIAALFFGFWSPRERWERGGMRHATKWDPKVMWWSSKWSAASGFLLPEGQTWNNWSVHYLAVRNPYKTNVPTENK